MAGIGLEMLPSSCLELFRQDLEKGFSMELANPERLKPTILFLGYLRPLNVDNP